MLLRHWDSPPRSNGLLQQFSNHSRATSSNVHVVAGEALTQMGGGGGGAHYDWHSDNHARTTPALSRRMDPPRHLPYPTTTSPSVVPRSTVVGHTFGEREEDEDAFDREHLSVTPQHNDVVATPRVFSPPDTHHRSTTNSPQQHVEYLVPQPDVVTVSNELPGGAYASLREDMLHRADPIGAVPTIVSPSQSAFSPPPRAPTQQPFHQRLEQQYPPLYEAPSETSRHHRGAPPMSLPRAPSRDSLDDETIEQGLSRMPSNVTSAAGGLHRSSPQSSIHPLQGAIMDFHGIPIPVPVALATGCSPSSLATGINGAAVPANRSPASQIPFQQQRPSRFLSAIVEAVALRKHAKLVPSIPLEVIHAFDSIVRDGAYFVKYTSGSAPHERFFQVRFVDVPGRAPEPCISWGVHRTSWSAKGVVNLAAIKRVSRGTTTRAFKRQLIDDRRIRGPMIGGPHRAVLPTTHAFWIDLHHNAAAAHEEDDAANNEPLSLLSLNTEVFSAWLTFLSFVITIGLNEAEDVAGYVAGAEEVRTLDGGDDGRCSSQGGRLTPQSTALA